jgi:hypothetical protein
MNRARNEGSDQKLATWIVVATLAVASLAASGCSPGASSSQAGADGSHPGAPGPSPEPPASPPPAPPAPDPGVSPSPSPEPSPSLRLSAAGGLYLLDPPLAAEPRFAGEVEVTVDGRPPPADAVVSLNGVPLVRTKGNGDDDRFWRLDPSAPQPSLNADGALTIDARTGTLAGTVTLPCPADLVVATSTPAGASLSGASALALGWGGPLPINPVATFASASLRGLDVATHTALSEVISHRVLTRGTIETSLPVAQTLASGYVAELRWQGAFQRQGNGDGFCGRAKRLFYAR